MCGCSSRPRDAPRSGRDTAPAGTRLRAIVEVEDESEEQPLPTAGLLEVQWLHRKDYPAGAGGVLVETARRAIEALEPDSFVWVACEKEDVRAIRDLMKSRDHDRKKMYAAWYWERTPAHPVS